MQKYEIYLNFMNFYDSLTLERIAYGEMESLIVLEAVVVEIARLARIERHVQTNTPVKTQNEEIEVVTKSDTRSYRQIAEKAAKTETAVFIHFLQLLYIIERFIGKPHVTSIEEHSTMKVAKQLATIFKVTNELDITITQQIAKSFIR